MDCAPESTTYFYYFLYTVNHLRYFLVQEKSFPTGEVLHSPDPPTGSPDSRTTRTVRILQDTTLENFCELVRIEPFLEPLHLNLKVSNAGHVETRHVTL